MALYTEASAEILQVDSGGVETHEWVYANDSVY